MLGVIFLALFQASKEYTLYTHQPLEQCILYNIFLQSYAVLRYAMLCDVVLHVAINPLPPTVATPFLPPISLRNLSKSCSQTFHLIPPK